MKSSSSLVGRLAGLVGSDAKLKRMLEASIEAAAAINPDRDTNPAQTLEEFYDYIDWSSTTLPRFILRLPESASLYDRIDQALDYFYFLIDQPLAELADAGYYYPSVQYYEPFCSWVTEYVKAWGSFLSSDKSWNEEYAEAFYADPGFGVAAGWYEDASNWKSYNDFFARRLRDASQRPVASPGDPSVLASPVDGVPQGIWKIDDSGYIVHEDGSRDKGVLLKSRYFDYVPNLIGPGSAYADSFAGGVLTHLFLDVNDYHRYHFPLSGTVLEMRHIPAASAGGGIYRWDASARRYVLECREPGWETAETRSCLILDTDDFGIAALMPIGMSQVCSVNFSEGLKAGDRVEKGQELGFFLFGGSDFVMLFQKHVSLDITHPVRVDESYAHILACARLGILSRR